MPPSPVASLSEWSNYYILIATVAVTIIGAMFVVASIASTFMTPGGAAQGRRFLSPIVLHLSSTVLGCAAVMVPHLVPLAFAILFGVGGLVGLFYSCFITYRIRRANLDLEDHLWYSVLPVIGYLVMLTAVILVLFGGPAPLETLAASVAILLVTGIRNAWDLTLFFVTRERHQG